MFTGLVEAIGEIVRVGRRRGVALITVRSPFPAPELRAGASISVHGVCLTLIEDGSAGGLFSVEAGPETGHRTTLGRLRTGDRVHLERALAAGDRLGGHFVQGHVDGVGRLRRVARREGERVLTIEPPAPLRRYLVEKGSVCIDGVSLTVGRMVGGCFHVHIIPRTAEATLIAGYRVGRKVNIEVDVLAKYVESLLRNREIG